MIIIKKNKEKKEMIIYIPLYPKYSIYPLYNLGVLVWCFDIDADIFSYCPLYT